MIDAYSTFLDKFKIGKEEFLKFGIEMIMELLPKKELIEKQWEDLKIEIKHDKIGHRRNYGRDGGKSKGQKNEIINNIIKELYGINESKIDVTNNAEPTKVINRYSGHKKNKDIFNYQVSHIWGKTLNPYCFKSLWNMAYIPILYDPFTGHEAKSDMAIAFTKELKSEIFKFNKPQISEFNEIIKSTTPRLLEILNEINHSPKIEDKGKERIIKDIKENFGKEIDA